MKTPKELKLEEEKIKAMYVLAEAIREVANVIRKGEKPILKQL